MHIYYNLNPDQNLVGDCVVRAIGTLTGENWDSTYLKICIQGLLMHDMPSSNKVWGAYLYKLGYRRYMARDTYPEIYTIKKFCEDHPRGAFLVCTDRHVVAVVDGNVLDTINCEEETPLYYWRKEA